MPQNDTAVHNAAVGYVYIAPVGTAAPTPAGLKLINPDTYGAQVQTLKITGSPTGGTFTLTAGGQTTAAIAFNATPAVVQAALAALTSVGAGNVIVTGTLLSDTNGFDVAWALAKASVAITITAAASFTGGTTPAIAVTQKSALTGWKSVGHTSRGTLPEFGFDGDSTEVRGSWQKKKLREIQTDDPIDYLSVVLHQFDSDALSLYYGDGWSQAAGDSDDRWHEATYKGDTEQQYHVSHRWYDVHNSCKEEKEHGGEGCTGGTGWDTDDWGPRWPHSGDDTWMGDQYDGGCWCMQRGSYIGR